MHEEISKYHGDDSREFSANSTITEWLTSLSLEEKIGQIFMARGLRRFPEETRDLIRRGWIGNIQAKCQEDDREELAVLQAELKIPLLVGAEAPDPDEHKRISLDISLRALTLDGDSEALPAGDRETMFIVANPGPENETGQEIGQEMKSKLALLLQQRFPNQCCLCIDETPSPAQIENALHNALDYRRVVFFSHALPESYKGTADLPAPQRALISALRDRLSLWVLLGNPYTARELSSPCAILFAYWGGETEQAVVESLAGDISPSGRLPVQW